MSMAGFPEIVNREPKCKLCQLVDTHRGLLRLVHRMAYEREYGAEALRNRVIAAFERHGVPCPAPRSFGRHFGSHVDFSHLNEDALAMPEPLEVTLQRLETDTNELRLADPEDLALGRNNSDYHELSRLFLRLQRRIEALDQDPTAFTNADGSHSFSKLGTWATLIDNARKVIEGLNKMRNSDRMMVTVLEQHTKRFATAISKPVATELRDIQRLLAASKDPVAHRALAQIEALLDERVREIMTDAASHSLRMSKEQYKLLN